jgi:glycosyltransferase involved in cell wall biosynthesis
VTEVSVIIPARDAAATLGETLEALTGQDFEGEYEVIVVDDGSRDDTAAVAGSAPGRVTVVRQAPAGPGPARNRGVAESSGSVLAFTDADCVPTPGWLRAGVAALAEADVVQGAVRPHPDEILRPFDRTVWVNGEVALYETANLLVGRPLFDLLGGFEDWLGTDVIGKPLAEDVWFGWRARRHGARIAFCAEALVHHAVFRRSLPEYARERIRLAYIPAIVERIPELRGELLFARLFLNRRTAAFDAAVVGALAALATGSRRPAIAGLPYAWIAARGAGRWRLRAPQALLGDLAADCVGALALLAGGVRRRTPVL